MGALVMVCIANVVQSTWYRAKLANVLELDAVLVAHDACGFEDT